MTVPALAARIQAALADLASRRAGRAAVEEILTAIGRDAEASGTRMADVVAAFLESINFIDYNNNVKPPDLPGRLPASLLRTVLGAFETARDSRHEASEASDANDDVGRLLAIQEEERGRLAAEIHDDAIQAVAAASIRVELLGRQLPSPNDREPYEALERMLRQSGQRLRRLAFELRPLALTTTLAGAVRDYLRQTELGATVAVHVVDGLATQPAEPGRLILYRAAQEALSNVARHAAASSITVALAEDAGCFILRIEDDGRGFRFRTGQRGQRGFGLRALRERAEAIGGSCRVESTPGRGTTVEVRVPRGRAVAPQS